MVEADPPKTSPQRAAPEGHSVSTADGRPLRWLVGGLALAGLAALLPFWAPLLLASWATIIAWPLQQRLTRATHHRSLVAAGFTSLLVIALLLPVAVAALSLSGAAIALGQRLTESKTSADALKALSAGGGFDLRHMNLQHALELARQHGLGALGALRSLFGALSVVVIALVVFVAAFYTLLVEGRQAYDWLVERAPLSHAHVHRFANVFAEVGRGLIVGVGLTALSQGAVATVGYLVTGVPQPLVLGLVTMCASLIPSVGSALVWVPVTAGLALSGRLGAAIAMLVIGIFVSLVDNLIRPLFVRYAKLRLHSLVLFLAMLGGIALIGAWGLLLGPLFVRLACEGLDMLREERAHTRADRPALIAEQAGQATEPNAAVAYRAPQSRPISQTSG